MVALPPQSATTVRAGQLNETARWRTPCGQSVNAASGRGDKPGATRLRRVAPGLSPLIHPLAHTPPRDPRDWLRTPAAQQQANLNKKKDGTRMAL